MKRASTHLLSTRLTATPPQALVSAPSACTPSSDRVAIPHSDVAALTSSCCCLSHTPSVTCCVSFRLIATMLACLMQSAKGVCNTGTCKCIPRGSRIGLNPEGNHRKAMKLVIHQMLPLGHHSGPFHLNFVQMPASELHNTYCI